MQPLFSIGRAGAGFGGTSAPSAANKPGGVSFGKSLEYVIDTTEAVQQRFDAGKGVQVKDRPLTPVPASSRADLSARSGAIPQQPQGTTGTQTQTQTSGNYGYGTTTGYRMDTVPATLDPRSMAFLLAWMGGSTDVQSIQQQQQSYLETYRLRYPDGVPGITDYTTATTNYLTGAS